jgi:DNA-directed RNA polymerase specialized sigma24 family protein
MPEKQFPKRFLLLVSSPEEVLERYYEQLCEWAIELTRGDTAVALDIVHDLCLYIRLAKPDLNRVSNLDGYLYRSLSHIHLSFLTQSTRNAERHISIAEFDSVQLALWMKPASHILEF